MLQIRQFFIKFGRIKARFMTKIRFLFFQKTVKNWFLGYIWAHLERRFEISMKNYTFWYVQIIYSSDFWKFGLKSDFYENTSNPPKSIFKKLDFEIYNPLNRGYSHNRVKKSVCQIDFLNLWTIAKWPHQQKERFFSAAANPWDFWSPAGNHKNKRFFKGSLKGS